MKYDILPLRLAFWRIILSTILISGSTGAGIYFYKWYERHSAKDEKYRLLYLSQQTEDEYALSNSYLEEILDLSKDATISLSGYNTVLATQRLLTSPFILAGTVNKYTPNTLCVQYQVRHPEAFLGEYANVLIDKNGSLMPFHPVFSAKKLPELVLGITDEKIVFGQTVSSSRILQALDVLQKAKDQETNMRTIIEDFLLCH